MSKAAELAALIGSQSALSDRNLIINGAMQVAQRSTSTASVTGSGYHACDRWNLQLSSLGTFTISQSTDAPAGFSNSFKVDCTTADASPAASDFMVVQQKIEAQTLRQLGYGASGAKAMTLSFYVKSNKTGTYEIMHFAADGTRAVNSTYTIDSANTWEFKSVSIPGDPSGTMNNDNGEGLRSLFYLGVGSQRQSGTTPTDWQAYAIANEAPSQTVNIADNTANEWLMTGVQLEVGEQTTPFEHRSFGDELERCKRYFQQIGSGYGKASSTSAFDCSVTFNPPMRANPTVSNNGTVIQITNITSADHNQSSASCADTDSGVTDGTYGGGRVRFSNFSGLTSGTTYAIDHTSSQGGAATFDAEL
tara:strand:+ start:404 stop:1492 length:1089 start_codon:yes stop_codon:yes gene_type:complete